MALQSQLSRLHDGNELDFEEQRRLRKVQDPATNLGFKLATAALKHDYSSVEDWVERQNQTPK
jgi:hypothetical protein